MSTITLTPAFDTRPAKQAQPAKPAQRVEGVQHGELRLTRRGRLVIFLTTLTLLLAASLALGASAVGTDEAQPTEVVLVGTGDTLWGIAAEHAPADDVRGVMSEIEELNDLDSPALMAGQRLVVPIGADE